MKDVNRSAKKTAEIIEFIITECNKKFKQNRNVYRKATDKNIKDDAENSKKLKKKALSKKELEIIKMKETQVKKRELEKLREELRTLKINREKFLVSQCKEKSIKISTIMNITGYNQIEEYVYQ